ncbi:GntR family transcriptional regulator [Noviherbaspirillum saxi]|uniref:GntR family transcriptional regulator n=1 Tax=Noviherbaspirillum saxi TaxID=2320863 RepID=A0A3A3G5L4_9BURK|nr:GntR family transcriptional regulator [Noviherbaspirillum saxi]RJF95470.1 GntR family transcriptional regulator [Noviherbaspirillum saxi]
MALTTLQTRVLREIIVYARRENLPAGTHLAEAFLAQVVGTSRFPISAALAHLAEIGFVKHDRNRGYFLAVPASELANAAQEWSAAAEDPLYLHIAQDRQRGRLPDVVNESDLMEQFGVTRAALRKVLSRIQQEGWIERRTGHGWEFLSMIDSPEAYEESYALRIAIEPAGILSPKFRLDMPALEACRRQQEFIAADGYRTMTPIELFEANARFHETIADLSGNRFILQTVRRLDQLRRLVEYMQAEKRLPRRAQAEEHLAILDALTKGDFLGAATLMRDHLDGARRQKALTATFSEKAA